MADETASTDLTALLGSLLSHVDEAVVICDDDGVITFAGPAIRELLGYDADAVVGRAITEFLHPDDLDTLVESLERWSGRRGAPRGQVQRIRAADGRWERLRWDAVVDPSLGPLGAMAFTMRTPGSVDEERALDRQRDLNEARLVRLASAFLDVPADRFERGLDDAVHELSSLEWVTRVTVWERLGDRFIRRAEWKAQANAPRAQHARRVPIDAAALTRRLAAGEEVHIRSSRHLPDDWAEDRRLLELAGVRSLLAVPMRRGGTVVGAVMAEVTLSEVGFDATHVTTLRSAAAILAAAFSRHRTETELARRARSDQLTGLANRFAFDEALAAALARRRPGLGPAVAILDLDRFKVVNDSLGHGAGDRILARLAERFRACTPPGSLVARLGGDEVLILHRDVRTVDEAMARTAVLLGALDAPFDVDGRPVRLTASAGIAHDVDSDDAEELLRRADVAMYEAKARGGGRIEVDDRSLSAGVVDRLHEESDLRAAVEGAGLEVHLQGEWALPEETLLGGEALARWRRDGELVPAADFIPLAEECGLIERLGARILHEACTSVAGWLAEGRADGFGLKVNLSPLQLRDEWLAEGIATVLDETGLPPERLCLELTESALLDDPDRAVTALSALRDLGVGLAVDDFGTGYSSLLYLKRLPITALKIDRAFIAGLPDDAADRAIVAAIVQLASQMGLEVTAEGVETEAQAEALVELGCLRAQGFWLSRPESVAQLSGRLGR